MRRRTLLTTALTVPLAALVARQAWREERRPANILMLCIDDLNSWIGCLDPPSLVHTPAIDALARRGTLFRHAYCAAPYCNASRYAVFTGCLPSTTGIYKDQDYWGCQDRHPLFIEHLRRHGYITFGAGKVLHGRYLYREARQARSRWAAWREVENRPFLWDTYLTSPAEPLPSGHPLNGIRATATTPPRPWSPQFDWGVLSAEEETRHPDTRVVETVSRFLSRNHERPFFCAVGLYKPHLPWYSPQRCFERVPLDSVKLPTVAADDLEDLPVKARQWINRQPDHDTLTRSDAWLPAVQAYLASVAFVDEQVGRIVDALDRSPHHNDTLIALWSDNGFHLGEKLHWRKFTLWEQATRVPLILVDPRTSGNRDSVDDPVGLIHLFPTLLDMAGVEPMPGIDGISWLPYLRGEDASRPPAVMSWGRGNDSIRQAGWRYIRYRDGGEELYDLRRDPWEHTNLRDDTSFAQYRENLSRQLQESLNGIHTGP